MLQLIENEVKYTDGGQIRYVIEPTGWNSGKLGPCEICGEYCEHVYRARVWVQYKLDAHRHADFIRRGQRYGWGPVEPDRTGHPRCLEEWTSGLHASEAVRNE
jgi:hypothetical protein